MPSWAEKTLKYNPGEKSLKVPYAIYIDLEFILKKVQSSQNNPEKSYTEKKARHEPSGWSMSIISSFDKKENKISYYRGKDCIEKLCKKIKESANEIVNYEKKEMIPLTKEEKKSYKNLKKDIYAKKSFVLIKMIKTILIEKRLKIIVIIQENLEELPIVNAI